MAGAAVALTGLLLALLFLPARSAKITTGQVPAEPEPEPLATLHAE
jgi:hypothetical protein